MGSHLAKRHGIDKATDSLPIRKNAARLYRKMSGRGDPAYESKVAKLIETVVLEKSATKPIPLARLVKELSNEIPYSFDRIVSIIVALQLGKKIVIREPTPYKRFMDYLLSPISFWFWELSVATMASLGFIFASSGLALFLRYIFGSVLVLFLPGYAFVGFIYFKRDDLDYLTRASVSFVMSLALTTLVGLALNFTPFGINLFPVALSLTAVTIGLLLLTVFRKYSYYRLAKMMMGE